MAIVLKSNSKIKAAAGTVYKAYQDYKDRVEGDGGIIFDSGNLLGALTFFKSKELESKLVSGVSPLWGVKYDSTGTKIAKLYNISGATGDINVTQGDFPLKPDGSFYTHGSNLNQMRSANFSAINNLSIITTFKNEGRTSSADFPLCDIYDANDTTGYNGGLILGTKYNPSTHTILTDAFGIYRRVTKEFDLPTDSKTTLSARMSENNTSYEAFHNLSPFGLLKSLDKGKNVNYANFYIAFACQGNAARGGAPGDYYYNIVLTGATRTEHLSVVEFLTD